MLTPDILARCLAHAVQVLLPWTPLTATVGLVAVFAAARMRRRRDATWRRHARQVTVQVPPEVDPAGGGLLWANLLGLLRPAWPRLFTGQPHVAFEYTWTDGELRIGLWVPGVVPPGLVEHSVEAAWPGALTTVTTAQPPLNGQHATGGRLRLARPDHYPLRHDHESDPLRALLGAVRVGDGESACVQVLARPVTGARLARAHHAAAQLRGGASTRWTSRLLDLLTPGPTRPTPAMNMARERPERAAEVRALLDKARYPRFAAAVTYAVATSNPDNHPEAQVRARLRGRAHAVASAFAVFTGHNHFRRRRLHDPVQALAERRLGRGQLLSVPELAALAHLPHDTTVPNLARAGARSTAPPPQIPTPGPTGKTLGDTDTGTHRPVAVAVADARHHLHVLGATGVGKSTLIANLVLADTHAGRGAVVIDPKGDLVTDLLPRLPAHLADNTVLIDPDDPSTAPGLNLLDAPDPHLAVEHLVGIFATIYRDFWGPRTDDVLRATTLTLTRQPGATLADIPRLLTDPGYRQHVTQQVREPVLRGFWDWYAQLSDPHRATITAPLLNKLRAFLLRPFVRDLITTPTTLDMTKILDGGLLLARLPKGSLGEETTRLLGSFLLARVWQTATRRARLPEHRRRDAGVYIDEAHNFLTLPHALDDMLAEARAYRVSLTLVHQNLGQLEPPLRDALSANARNKVYFTVSPDDARHLRHHVSPTVGEHDLAHLGAYQAAARLIVDNAETPAFTLRTRRLPPPVRGRARHIRDTASTHAATRTRRTVQPLPVNDPRLPSTVSGEDDR